MDTAQNQPNPNNQNPSTSEQPAGASAKTNPAVTTPLENPSTGQTSPPPPPPVDPPITPPASPPTGGIPPVIDKPIYKKPIFIIGIIAIILLITAVIALVFGKQGNLFGGKTPIDEMMPTTVPTQIIKPTQTPSPNTPEGILDSATEDLDSALSEIDNAITGIENDLKEDITVPEI